MSTLSTPEGKKEACRLFAEGMALAAIGRRFGVTKQRVHQVIKKAGIPSARKLAAAKRRADEEAVRNARCLSVWGCTYAEWKRLRQTADRYDQTPMGRFQSQKSNAGKRGIEWRLTFQEWWSIWVDSGKWYRRGKMIGEYVLARFGDHGPYSVDNVYITTTSQNIRDGYEARGICQPELHQ